MRERSIALFFAALAILGTLGLMRAVAHKDVVVRAHPVSIASVRP